MANWWWFTKLHRAVYRATGGLVGRRLMGLDMALLTTRGRKTGRERTVPLACFPRGPGLDDDVIVVASNNGQDRAPTWWRNLAAHPEATLRLGGEERRVTAREATPAERAELWPWLLERNPFLHQHEEKTDRPIPVVILRKRADRRARSEAKPSEVREGGQASEGWAPGKGGG